MLGDLIKCPTLYHNFICQTCKKEFSFLSGIRCECEKNHKYRAKKIIVNDIKFDSLNEGLRFSKLAFLESRGVIQDLILQKKFPVRIDDKLMFTYICDFEYLYQGQVVTEDVKGKRTAVFNLKLKFLKVFYPTLNLVLTQVGNKSKKVFKKNSNFTRRIYARR